MIIKQVNVGDLRPADYNPRVIDASVMAKLKKGLQEFGFVEPIVVNADMTVVGGHQRLKAAIEMGMEQVPCTFVNLDKRHEKALNLALNKLHGEWDYGSLSSMLKDLETGGDFDVELSGFDSMELSALATTDSTFAKMGESSGGTPEIDFSGDGYLGIGSTEGSDSRGGVNIAYLSIGLEKIPMTEEEQKALVAIMNEYEQKFGYRYGFPTFLLNRGA